MATTTRTSDRRPRTRAPTSSGARWQLWAVAGGYLALQVLLVGFGRGPGFDEAIYLSEVLPGAESISWAAHRAPGILALIWPAARTGSLVAIRVWLAVLSTVGLWMAFRPWLRVVGPDAVVAAAVCATGWAVVFYGSEVFPNLPAALAAVAAGGYAVSAAQPGRGRSRHLAAAAVAAAVVAVLRPVDVLWLVASLGVALVVWYGRRGLAAGIVVGIGGAVGWVPWIAEAYRRFDGPIERFQAMRGATLDIAVSGRFPSYLDVIDGPMSVPDGDAVVSPLTVVVLVVVVALGVLGTGARTAGTGQRGVRVAAVCAVGVLAPYVVLTDAVYVRFLLAPWALAAIPVARGLWRLRSSAGTGSGRTAVVVMLAGWLAWNVVTLERVVDEDAAVRQELAALSAAVTGTVEQPCYLFVEGNYPSLGITTGCAVGYYRPDADRVFRHDPAGRAAKGLHVYTLHRSTKGPAAGWPGEDLEQLPGWRLASWPGRDG